jgi:hypothetical protein
MNSFDGLNIMPNGIHIFMGATNRPMVRYLWSSHLLMKLNMEWIVTAKTLGLTTKNCSGQPKGTHFM